MQTEREREQRNAANRRWRAAHKAQVQAINKAYQQANGPAINERHRQRRAANPGKVRSTNTAQRAKRTEAQKTHIAALNRAWKQDNREHVNAQAREYYAANPVPLTARNILRRSVKPTTEFDVFVSQEAVRLCKLRKKATGNNWHTDHLLPLSRGGDGSALNIQVVPAKWNLVKGNRHSGLFFPVVDGRLLETCKSPAHRNVNEN